MRLHFDMPRAGFTAPASAAHALVLTTLAVAAACSDVAGPSAPLRRPVGPTVASDSSAVVDPGITLQKAPLTPGAGPIPPCTIVPKGCPPRPPQMLWSYRVDNQPYVSVPTGAPTPVASASHALAIRIDANQFKGLTMLDAYATVDGRCVAYVLHTRKYVAPYTDDFASYSAMEGGGPGAKELIIRFNAGKLLGGACKVPSRGTALKGTREPTGLRITLLHSTHEDTDDIDNIEFDTFDVKLTP